MRKHQRGVKQCNPGACDIAKRANSNCVITRFLTGKVGNTAASIFLLLRFLIRVCMHGAAGTARFGSPHRHQNMATVAWASAAGVPFVRVATPMGNYITDSNDIPLQAQLRLRWRHALAPLTAAPPPHQVAA